MGIRNTFWFIYGILIKVRIVINDDINTNNLDRFICLSLSEFQVQKTDVWVVDEALEAGERDGRRKNA